MSHTDGKLINRWNVVIGAILIQLCLGAIYAWSVFTPVLKEAGWTGAQSQYVFSAGLASFAVVMVIAGRLMPKIGPQKLAFAGGAVLGIGYILAGLIGGGLNFWSTFIFVGIVGGAGIGLAYVVPIAVGMRWFPDKKGLITGLAVAGFGFGAMLWVKLGGSWGHMLENIGISTTFIIYGVAFFIAVAIGSKYMIFPPKGYVPEGWVPPVVSGTGFRNVEDKDFSSGEMLRTPQFYMLLLIFAFGASAGLMSIGLMKLFPIEALEGNGYSIAEASAIAGTAMAVFFSLANGLGRILWGMASDKLGRRKSIIIMMATQAVFVICFQWAAGSPTLLYLFAALIGFNFGGNFALFPTATADIFGTKYVGQNYGWVFLAYGVGGILGPVLGGKLGDMKNFPMAFTICGVLCLVAAGITMAVRSPHKPHLHGSDASSSAGAGSSNTPTGSSGINQGTGAAASAS
ncbi:MAG: OFA family MFS transporter [Planctomycetes bacterium]|nr:OFA family MFS transporter [Planctomycetota bacterium]